MGLTADPSTIVDPGAWRAVEQWTWTLLAAVTYTVLSIWHKWLLNWIVGRCGSWVGS